jgi:DNA-binding NarL/FixJ family response regulator
VSESDVLTVVVGRLPPLVGLGLADVLRKDRSIHVLASGLADSELARTIARQAPHVAILGEAVAHSELRHLQAVQPRTTLLVLAHDPEQADGLRLLASGASCLARSTSPADLLGAIHLTARGTRVFVSPGGQRIERRYPSAAHLLTLTARETQVATLVSEGRSNPEIASALHISVETARTHVATILRKLDVQSRRELIGMSLPSAPRREAD